MRGGARPGAGRRPVKAKKVCLSIYVKPETKDQYRTLRRLGQPVREQIERAIQDQYRIVGVYHLEGIE